MEKSYNTLSLFNGMGCIWIAMEMAGHKIGKRYSSEIEKYPNQANDAMFPDTEQLGDVRNVDVSKLERIDFLGGAVLVNHFLLQENEKECLQNVKLKYYH